jgi:quinol monooxygenase YgiN
VEHIIAGTFVVDPQDRDRFLAGRADLMRRSRQEPGCITYVFAADPLDPSVIELWERWESEEAVEGHRRVLTESPPADPGVNVQRAEVRQFAATEVPRP